MTHPGRKSVEALLLGGKELTVRWGPPLCGGADRLSQLIAHTSHLGPGSCTLNRFRLPFIKVQLFSRLEKLVVCGTAGGMDGNWMTMGHRPGCRCDQLARLGPWRGAFPEVSSSPWLLRAPRGQVPPRSEGLWAE